MNDVPMQATLSADQIEAFYHDQFVDDQVSDFRELLGPEGAKQLVVDIGGGCGFFAKQLAETSGGRTRVIDMDPRSVEECGRLGVEAKIGDALAPVPDGDEDIVTFNLILHHLVGNTERDTRALQIKALKAWRGKAKRVFVNEYIYQSFVGYASGSIIYQITSNQILSFIGRQLGKIVPAFRANTFGVGVRFRAHEEWRKLFAEAGFRVVDTRIGKPEHISPPLRGMLIKIIRRDSFLLEAA